MKTFAIGAIAALGGMLMGGAANAQFFNYSVVVTPNPITTTVSGNVFNVTNGSNVSGSFSGGFGTDIVAANFAAVATSASTGTFSGLLNVAVTLIPTDSLGNALLGDSPVTHVYTPTLNIIGLNSGGVSSNMTGLPSAQQSFAFADGSVFSVFLQGYVGPSAPNGVGSGSLGAHVNGALAGVRQNLPEPGSWALIFGAGFAGAAAMRRRRKI